jgi:hypothetical protein
MPCLNHRHAKVRISAIEAIDALVTIEDKAKCKGAGTEAIADLAGFKESNVLSVSVRIFTNLWNSSVFDHSIFLLLTVILCK